MVTNLIPEANQIGTGQKLVFANFFPKEKTVGLEVFRTYPSQKTRDDAYLPIYSCGHLLRGVG